MFGIPAVNVRNDSEQRQPHNPLRLFGVLNGIIEIFLKKNQTDAQHAAEKQTQKQILRFLRLYRMSGNYGRINNVYIADGGCLGNARFFMLLQEEGVDSGVDAGNTGKTGKIALCFRKRLHSFFVKRELMGNVALLFGQVVQMGFICRPYLSLNFFYLALNGFYRGMVLRIVVKQSFLLYFQLGQFGRHRGNQRIVTHDRRRVDGSLTHGSLQGIKSKFYLLFLESDIGTRLFHLRYFLNEFSGFVVQADNSGRAFVNLQVFLRIVQFLAQPLYLVFNKVHCAAGFFRLERYVLFQIGLNQRIDDIARPHRVGGIIRNLNDAGHSSYFNCLDSTAQACDNLIERQLSKCEFVAFFTFQIAQKKNKIFSFNKASGFALAGQISVIIFDLKYAFTI